MSDTNYLLIGLAVTFFVILANFLFFFGLPLIVRQLRTHGKSE